MDKNANLVHDLQTGKSGSLLQTTTYDYDKVRILVGDKEDLYMVVQNAADEADSRAVLIKSREEFDRIIALYNFGFYKPAPKLYAVRK